jgi:protein TonB
MTAHPLVLLHHDDRAEIARWSAAAAAVLAAHAGLVALYLVTRPIEPPGSREAPVVTIDLAPLPEAPSTQRQDMAPGPQTPPPEPEIIQSKPRPAVEPQERPQENPMLALPEHTLPEQKQEERKTPVLQTAPANAERSAIAPATSNAGRNAVEAIPPSWISRLRAHLDSHRQYPQGRREEGVVTLNFTMDRNGHILAQRVAKSSGSPALDKEALATLQRAQPLPPFPSSMTNALLNLNWPIRFSLR